MQIYAHIHICIYICICTHVYIYLHNSCMRACATVQQLPCHGSYCELILSPARASCRQSFAARPPAGSTKSVAWRCLLKKSVQIHASSYDTVAAAVLHKHRLIIRVGVGLIQFVCRSHSRLAMEFTCHRKAFPPFFARVFQRQVHVYIYVWRVFVVPLVLRMA